MVVFSTFIVFAALITLVIALPISKPVGSFTTPTKATGTSNGILPMISPAYLPSFPFHGVKASSTIPTGPIPLTNTFKVRDYPPLWTAPDLNHPGVKAAINSIDWDYVPDFDPSSGTPDTYDIENDEACWWTASQCTTPNVPYLPEDIKFCPKVGDFGLV
jgi:hypothetical protein